MTGFESGDRRPNRLAPGDARGESWVAIGRRLAHASTKRQWRALHASFSNWLSAQALELGLKDASLWRYMSAVRDFEVIQRDLRFNGIDCPDIDSLAERVSPENIEILAKIRRVALAPDEEILRLSKALVDGSLRREELRQAWARFKTLEDRGTPRRPEQVIHPSKRRMPTGQVIDSLGSQKPRVVEGYFRERAALFCGTEAPLRCTELERLFVRTLGPAIAASPAADWIVAIQVGHDEPMQYHGIYGWNEGLQPQLLARINEQQALFDSVWIYAPYGTATNDFVQWQPSWGYLEHSSYATLRVMRAAARQPRSEGSQVVHLADAILARLLGNQVMEKSGRAE